jgi:prevent-host-death family protein
MVDRFEQSRRLDDDWSPDTLDNVATWSYNHAVKTVGLRELKNRLAEYVREVRSGEGVLVTDRGEVVAELVPPGPATTKSGAPSGLVALAKTARLTLGADNDPAVYPKLSRLLKRHRAAELLDAERGGR